VRLGAFGEFKPSSAGLRSYRERGFAGERHDRSTFRRLARRAGAEFGRRSAQTARGGSLSEAARGARPRGPGIGSSGVSGVGPSRRISRSRSDRICRVYQRQAARVRQRPHRAAARFGAPRLAGVQPSAGRAVTPLSHPPAPAPGAARFLRSRIHSSIDEAPALGHRHDFTKGAARRLYPTPARDRSDQ
jgi:hypothetical protein